MTVKFIGVVYVDPFTDCIFELVLFYVICSSYFIFVFILDLNNIFFEIVHTLLGLKIK